ncbi:hypothetical protein BCR35DRAFT_109839 [Leucosporidium creatinivorum]|uniref:F-box domain-containing protein n=1 Tax=Leucosporidium creatinivorum TaxID=106004 RepID=A0A1Y2G1Z9_9BASI|nr:hypothetical protein BCR35DRAFT_109839 [Leucosporidium creatinivorum]
MAEGPTPTPPALKLSEEAQDLICSFVSSLQRDSSKTLCALALTHRAFLDSARRALYQDPLKNLASPQWKRADQLYVLSGTLSSSPHLASHVRDLSYANGVVDAASALQGPGDSSPFFFASAEQCRHAEIRWDVETSDMSAAIRWAKVVLEVCSQLEAVKIGVRSCGRKGEATPLLQRIRPGRLTSIFLEECKDLDAAYKLFRSWTHSPTNLKHLESFGVAKASWGPLADASDSHGRLPFTVINLTIDPTFPSVPETLACYPFDLSLTTALRLAGDAPGADIMALLQPVRHQLKTFEYLTGNEGELPTLLGYPFFNEPAEILQLPSAFFASLPEARKIILNRTCRMTLDNLSVLATNSPKLESLLLSDSAWLDLNLDEFAASVITILRPLPLKKLDIGLLPILFSGGKAPQLAELEDFCSERAIEFSWSPCFKAPPFVYYEQHGPPGSYGNYSYFSDSD